MNEYHMLNFIGGKWIGEGKRTITNPGTGEIVGTVPIAGKQETQQAIEAAAKAFPTWSRKTAKDRAQALQELHHLLIKHKQELAELMTREMGRPLSESLAEVIYAASFLEWFAEEGKRVYGRTVPGKSPNHRIQVIKQPVGVVAAITPWNFPASMITRKLAPALAAGCTFLVKPAEQTPLTALKIAELSQLAGIPAGVVNVISANPQDFAEAIMQDARVRKISFTGSTEVGKHLMRLSADQVKRISLELGGHAPFFIFDDADIEQALEAVMASKFRNSGQTCVCANRIYVQEGIYTEFTHQLATRIQRLQLGDGMQPHVDVGPLIDQKSYHKVENQVKDAVERGARCLVGGKGIKNDEKKTYFFEPTLLIDMNDDMLTMREETFGPVAPVQPFQSEEEAVRLANQTPYGLAAYVFTRDVGRGTRVIEQLEFGIVGWNDGVPSTAQAPFGGVKQSGLGREGATEGMEEYLYTKYISLSI